MDEAEFDDLMSRCKGTYHLVDDQGRYIIRKETGRRVFGTFIDYNRFLVFFEGPDVREENVLKEAFSKSNWISIESKVLPCDCEAEGCEGKLPITLFKQEIGLGWNLRIEGE